VSPTGESVASLLARIARQASMIEELVRERDASRARNAELEAVIKAQSERMFALEALVGELAAKLGRDSSNSSKPPGSDGPKARAERRAEQKQRREAEREAGGKRKPGGQVGHGGGGLELRADPDARMPQCEPEYCAGCGAGLAKAALAGRARLQVLDLPSDIRVLVTEYLLASRRCSCGCVTRADLPEGVGGMPVAYGPNLQAMALLLRAHGQCSLERVAELLYGMFGIEVSTGWLGKLERRLDANLSGFEEDLKTALLAEPVLLGDETPVNTITDSAPIDPVTGTAFIRAFHPYVFTVRSLDLVWLGAGHTRGHGAIDAFGLLDKYTGTFVSDDFNGYVKYEATLAARQLCNIHLIRSLRGVHEPEPALQGWAHDMIEVLRGARAAVVAAEKTGRTRLKTSEIDEIRAEYLRIAAAGAAGNARRRTSSGAKHPALVLAERLIAKIDQVLHHITDFAVPWTSNLAEQALRHTKIHLKISGCFRTLATTRVYCRIHSYLATTRLQGIAPIQALRAALTGRAWTPLPPAVTAT
jgi:hypothetical protein